MFRWLHVKPLGLPVPLSHTSLPAGHTVHDVAADADECTSKSSTWSAVPQASGRARQEAIIDRLPPELLSAIGSLLCHQQLAVLAQVSTRFRSLAVSRQGTWHRCCMVTSAVQLKTC